MKTESRATRRHYLWAAAAGLVVAGAAAPSLADFPQRPIEFIVNYAAGSGTDMLARPFAQALSDELGVPVNVVNRAGAAGTIGHSVLKDAAPDGYTIGMITFTPMALTPHLIEVDYTPDDFSYFAAIGEWLYGIYVCSGRDWADIGEVVAWARENPGQLRHAYASHANLLPMLYLAEAEELDVVFLPTDGGGESESMCAGGHIDTIARHPNILERFEESEIRFIHPAGSSSWDAWGAGDRPSLLDLGYDIDVASWAGIGAPAGLPEDVHQILYDAIARVAEREDVQANTFAAGLLPINMPGAEYERFIRDGLEEFRAVLEKFDF